MKVQLWHLLVPQQEIWLAYFTCVPGAVNGCSFGTQDNNIVGFSNQYACEDFVKNKFPDCIFLEEKVLYIDFSEIFHWAEGEVNSRDISGQQLSIAIAVLMEPWVAIGKMPLRLEKELNSIFDIFNRHSVFAIEQCPSIEKFFSCDEKMAIRDYVKSFCALLTKTVKVLL